MSLASIVALWAVLWVLVAAVLTVAGLRRGRRLPTAAWLVTIGAFLAAQEDPLLLIQMASTRPRATGLRDGVLGLVHAHTRGHMYGAAVLAAGGLGLAVVIAHAALRRGEAWAWWSLTGFWLLGTALSEQLGAVLADAWSWQFIDARDHVGELTGARPAYDAPDRPRRFEQAYRELASPRYARTMNITVLRDLDTMLTDGALNQQAASRAPSSLASPASSTAIPRPPRSWPSTLRTSAGHEGWQGGVRGAHGKVAWCPGYLAIANLSA
jgi:hypothetical protein